MPRYDRFDGQRLGLDEDYSRDVELCRLAGERGRFAPATEAALSEHNSLAE